MLFRSYITGVQLEVGTQATPFDWRPYGTELNLCRRYYYQLDSSTSPYSIMGVTGGSHEIYTFWHSVPMRVSPTANFDSGTLSEYYFTSAGGGQLVRSVTKGITTIDFNTSINGGRFFIAKIGQSGLGSWADIGGSNTVFTMIAEL